MTDDGWIERVAGEMRAAETLEARADVLARNELNDWQARRLDALNTRVRNPDLAQVQVVLEGLVLGPIRELREDGVGAYYEVGLLVYLSHCVALCLVQDAGAGRRLG
jgi:hypothetical protein